MDVYSIVWSAILLTSLFVYFVLDGLDLGVGVASVLFSDNERAQISLVMRNLWKDENSWVVFGGASLYGTFPLAFSLLYPAYFFPLLLLVCALLFRGIVFEARSSQDDNILWERAYWISSVVAAALQGLLIGSFVQNIFGQHALVNVFSLTSAVVVVAGYALVGCVWLQSSVELSPGNLRILNRAKSLMVVSAILIAVSCLEFFKDHAATLNQQIPFLSWLVSCVFILGSWVISWNYLERSNKIQPFYGVVGVMFVCFVTFLINNWHKMSNAIAPVWHVSGEIGWGSDITSTVSTLILLPIFVYQIYHAWRIFMQKMSV